MQTRCMPGELAIVSRPYPGERCTDKIIGRAIVQVRAIVGYDILSESPVWSLETPIKCPREGCRMVWAFYPDLCLRPLRDKPAADEPDVYEVPKEKITIQQPAGPVKIIDVRSI